MRIEELLPGQKVTLMVNVSGQNLEFETTVQESYPKKRYILLDPIMSGDKAVSFKGKNIIIHLIVTIGNDKPHLFQNVPVLLQKKSDGTLCYQVASLADSVLYNRRENFRCFVGLDTSVQGGADRSVHPAVIRDISYTGFAVICDAGTNFDTRHVIHAILRDRIEETGENYSFHLYGTIARIQEMNNGRVLYGCRLNDRVPGLDKYIMAKERYRLRKTNGGNL